MTAITTPVHTGKTRSYSLVKILGIWIAATAPMAILGWIVYPRVAPDFEIDPLGAAVTRVGLLTLGLVWLFILSLIIVRQDEGNLSWSIIRHRLWLQRPLDPQGGQGRRKLWLWIIPALAGVALLDIFLSPVIDDFWVTIFPVFTEPAGYNFGVVFENQAILDQLVDAWWFLALFILFSVFNTFLGEELLFRGVLLPKMSGVFGRWSWVANGLLFGLYHIHQPWGIMTAALGGIFFFALPAWRFRSTWMAIIVHSAQSVYLAFLILGVVLGMA